TRVGITQWLEKSSCQPFISLQRPAQLRPAGTGQEPRLAQNYFRLRYCPFNIHILKFTLLPSYLISNPPCFQLLFETPSCSRPSGGAEDFACPLTGVLGFVAAGFTPRKPHQGEQHCW
uniref:Uncharacterized protein n=1 Tax=Ficedula albicollis TaxID=59894 RepID=A0A803W2Y8_FICAL